MKTEIEVKFCKVHIDDVREQLKKAGATCAVPMRMMRRTAFDHPSMHEGKQAYLRVRDEVNKVTMTYKQFDNFSLHGAKEIETTVGSYEDAVAIIAASGLTIKNVQETRRETWHLGDVEIVIDEWPWLDPFIEIEGPNEQQVRDTAAALGFDWKHSVFGDVTEAYRQSYPDLRPDDTMNTVPEIKFGASVPERLYGK